MRGARAAARAASMRSNGRSRARPCCATGRSKRRSERTRCVRSGCGSHDRGRAFRSRRYAARRYGCLSSRGRRRRPGGGARMRGPAGARARGLHRRSGDVLEIAFAGSSRHEARRRPRTDVERGARGRRHRRFGAHRALRRIVSPSSQALSETLARRRGAARGSAFRGLQARPDHERLRRDASRENRTARALRESSMRSSSPTKSGWSSPIPACSRTPARASA